MFEPGSQAWRLRKNTYKGGRLTKEQLLELAGLVPKSIAAWRYVLEKDTNAIEWYRLKVEVAKDIMAKFVADLTQLDGEIKTDYSDSVKQSITDIFTRLSGFSSKDGTSGSDVSKPTDTPAKN
jgi:hypothetical protein